MPASPLLFCMVVLLLGGFAILVTACSEVPSPAASASPIATFVVKVPASATPAETIASPMQPATASPTRQAEVAVPSPDDGPQELWLPFVSGRDQTPPPTITPSPSPTSTPSPTFTPEATATPVPVPTIDWPEPLAASGPSKLGIHVIQNNSSMIMEFVRRVRPAVVKGVGDLGWLGEVKVVSPETVTIGRLQPTHQDMNGDPALAAQSFVAEQLQRYLLNPGVDYWEGWNEPDPGERMDWYAAFEAERVRLLAQHGLRAAIGGFSAGVPEWDEFVAFMPAVQAAQEHNGILSLHEYGAPTFDFGVGTPLPGWPGHADRGVLALRYRWWYEELLMPRGLVIPLVISEAGVDGMLMAQDRPGPPGLGWRDFTSYWESLGIGGGVEGYIHQLRWYDEQLRSDDYVIGFTVFTAGGGDRWSSYELIDALPKIAYYVAQAQ